MYSEMWTKQIYFQCIKTLAADQLIFQLVRIISPLGDISYNSKNLQHLILPATRQDIVCHLIG